MIAVMALVEWHKTLELPLEFGWFPGPREPEYGVADQVGVITPSPGPSADFEGIGDYTAFQVKMTAREFNLDKLQQSAFEVDRQLRFELVLPGNLWGTRVDIIDRTGGQPSIVQEDEFDRIAYVCTYFAHELI